MHQLDFQHNIVPKEEHPVLRSILASFDPSKITNFVSNYSKIEQVIDNIDNGTTPCN